jgi:hypothetical protein
MRSLPKFESIVFSRRAGTAVWRQQAAIRTAADETVAAAASDRGTEATDLTLLCQAHVHVVSPKPSRARGPPS